MRYLKSPAFVLGAVLLTASIFVTGWSFQTDLNELPAGSWDVSVPMQVSLLSLGLMVAGLALVIASFIRLRARKNAG